MCTAIPERQITDAMVHACRLEQEQVLEQANRGRFRGLPGLALSWQAWYFHPCEQEGQHRLPINCNLVAGIGSLLVRVGLRRWCIGRELLENIILPVRVRSTREQPRPGLRIVIGSTWPMVRMLE